MVGEAITRASLRAGSCPAGHLSRHSVPKYFVWVGSTQLMRGTDKEMKSAHSYSCHQEQKEEIEILIYLNRNSYIGMQSPAWDSEGCAGLGSWNTGISPCLPFSPATWDSGPDPGIPEAGKALQDQSPAFAHHLVPSPGPECHVQCSLATAGLRQRAICSFAVELLNLIHIY